VLHHAASYKVHTKQLGIIFSIYKDKKYFKILAKRLCRTIKFTKKRAQRALDRSPEK